MATKLFFLIIVIVISDVTALQLVKVVMLSRHNIRAPLSDKLEEITPNIWPKWSEEPSFLTHKGGLLESFMGDYFSQWLKQEGLFREECPKEDSTLIYANAPQRTHETAKAFVKAAFRNCNISVYHKHDVTMDPVFNPIILNTTETFKQKLFEVMQNKLDELKLQNSYLKLNQILDFKNSLLCKETGFCDLTKKKDEILFKVGDEPNIYGPLSIGNSVIDALLMAFYNGTALEEIGWGGIENDHWELLTRITKENQNVRFNSTYVASHIAHPLLRKMSKIMSRDDLNFVVLFGHDSNINSVISSLQFKPFDLPNQYERTPVGGKLVFQKWFDEKQDRNLLRIEYVYQTTEQIRDAIPLSSKTPPNSVRLELTNCIVDENGLCEWTDFIKILGKFD